MLEKFKNIKTWHIIVIILGAIFMLIGAFHSNIWFDEAYTVGLVRHSFLDIIKIGIHDVHPLFYYLILRLFTIFTGDSIIAMRIFSILGMVLLSILGYTHIRKGFGEKTGLIFSLLVSFLPVTLAYSNEIRMYSWTAVFVLLTGIYAYRITKENSIKNWILFSIFSLFSAYTHYFATIAIGLINLILFIYVIKNRQQEKIIVKWITSAATQIILFIPGLLVLAFQAFRVAGGFWINIKYPDILLDILKFNFIGEVTENWISIFVLVFASLLFIYLIVKSILEYKKDKIKIVVPILSGCVYLGVIILTLLISFKMQDIFTTRYTIPMLGLLILFIAYVLSISNNKITAVICAIIIALSINNSVIFFSKNYDKSNIQLSNIINEKVEKDDIFVYSEIGLGSIIAEYYPDNKQYFYNAEHWTVEEAYKAFAPQMETIEDLGKIEDFKGRIWIIDGDNNKMYDIISKYSNAVIIKEQEKINTSYRNTNWIISLIEKK